jgi:putative ABC transport system permease protein
LNLQREQIAILKAFGFANRAIVLHYLKFACAIVVVGVAFGGLGGALLGHKLVRMYELWFRFPNLSFHLDGGALVWASLVGVFAAMLGVFNAVRRAAKLPPAEAMRPEPPASYRPAVVERTGIGRFLSHTFRIAVRNIERRPMQALFTVTGLALATGILIVPSTFRDSVKQILGFQWDVLERQDVGVGLVEPGSAKVTHLFEQLPGVVSVEPFRATPVRLRFGHRSRQLAIRGMHAGGIQTRMLDKAMRAIPLPANGLVISAKLAEVLGARVGDSLTVETLEGKRIVRDVPLVGLAEDLTGVTAYMDRVALNRFLEEGDVVTGANLTLDNARRGEFLHELKGIPRVSWIAIKESLRENFRKTTGASINLIQSIYLTFATVVAFGVVYNIARRACERAGDIARGWLFTARSRQRARDRACDPGTHRDASWPLAGHWLRHGHHQHGEHRDRPPSARPHDTELRYSNAHRDGRFHALGGGRFAESQTAQSRERIEGAGMMETASRTGPISIFSRWSLSRCDKPVRVERTERADASRPLRPPTRRYSSQRDEFHLMDMRCPAITKYPPVRDETRIS